MQQEVVEARVATLRMVCDKGFAALEPVGRRQSRQHVTRDCDPLCRIVAGVDAPQQVLQLVHAGAAVQRVHHQRERAIICKHIEQRPQPRIRIGEMVQHSYAVDEVEAAESQPGQVEQRALHERYVR